MSDIKLFQFSGQSVTEVQSTSMALEKSLQTLIEKNLEIFLGVRFIASEYSTGTEHGGRIDTLGLDENRCPVIIEYKLSSNMNVINQGLYYLDWLVNHRGDFEILVMKKFDKEEAQKVEWSSPRLVCIAAGFSKYDDHAIKQMNHNIELIRYINFENGLMLLEQTNAVSSRSVATPVSSAIKTTGYKYRQTTVSEYLEKADKKLTSLYESVRTYLNNLGDDVQEKTLSYYIAFKRIRNFACIEIRPQDKKLLVFLKVSPDTIELVQGFTRDVRSIGHYGTGDLEVTIRSTEDLDKAKTYFLHSYENA
ncbi:MAG: DUF91 domain-containing protein [Gammaproteobacteria bacterium]|nr:DUF91 domain-containing protein [Gammaproteobacteria bacterium]MYH86818.1 DUF91 domain-containing protein [Gammaproteobacteria bacterium]MYK04217.1 DUF91 domain-containing protein [Gammaproteobacteria bacterium]